MSSFKFLLRGSTTPQNGEVKALSVSVPLLDAFFGWTFASKLFSQPLIIPVTI